ncbi:MAG: ubiquinone/menaquinone biosynthesis methyltransferase [Chloroflexota bacterium]
MQRTPRPSERPQPPEQRQIETMFDGIVPHYDLLNGLMALGQDRRWRRLTLGAIAAAPPGPVLDLGCGTGALAQGLAGRRPVVGIDISAKMLRSAQARLAGRAGLVRGSAFSLPFGARAFSAVVSGFVLRNLDQLDTAFAEAARVLRPGGVVALLDATLPRHPLVRPLFDLYFGRLPPLLGSLVGRREAYRYLVRSLAHLPPPAELCARLERAGLARCGYRPLLLGTVTLFTGVRPA